MKSMIAGLAFLSMASVSLANSNLVGNTHSLKPVRGVLVVDTADVANKDPNMIVMSVDPGGVESAAARIYTGLRVAEDKSQEGLQVRSVKKSANAMCTKNGDGAAAQYSCILAIPRGEQSRSDD